MVTRSEPGDPAQIGRYRVLGQLGEGGMGRVLLGVGPDGRLVAIKQVHTHLLTERDFLPRFRREVQTSARVSGAYTAAVVDFDVESESPWLASVFVPGVSLDHAVEKYGPLGPEQIRTLAVGLASALQSIHGAGLIHRDLKPGNVILAEDGPRVIDFGIARVANERSDLTHTGTVIGSPAFMSPEQAQSEPLTSASDVFSLGSVLAMAASGASPFAGNSMPHVLYKIVNTEPDLSAVAPEVRELVEPCLNRDVAVRPTPAQILDFLGPLPPQQQPWPLAVHRAIYEQSRELSVLVSDPEATQIPGSDTATIPEPPGADFDRRVGQFLAVAREAHTRRRRRLLTAAFAGVVVLVAAVVGGVFAFGGGDGVASAAPNPLAGLDLTALRSLDMCAVMKDPLDSSLGKWTGQPVSTQWGQCSAQVGKYTFGIVAERIGGDRDTGGRAAGVPLLEPPAGKPGVCARALPTGKGDPQFGITVTVTGPVGDSATCDHAGNAAVKVAQRIEAGTPNMADIRNSLAEQDPCTLIDNSIVRLNVGEESVGATEGLHSCRWSGPNTVTVTLSRGPVPDPGNKNILINISPSDSVFIDSQEEFAKTCTRQDVYRTLDDGSAEVVTVQVDNPSDMVAVGLRCIVAHVILSDIMENLPGVK